MEWIRKTNLAETSVYKGLLVDCGIFETGWNGGLVEVASTTYADIIIEFPL